MLRQSPNLPLPGNARMWLFNRQSFNRQPAIRWHLRAAEIVGHVLPAVDFEVLAKAPPGDSIKFVKTKCAERSRQRIETKREVFLEEVESRQVTENKQLNFVKPSTY